MTHWKACRLFLPRELIIVVCKKCHGRIFVDRIFSERSHVELFCVICGKRWLLDKYKNALAAYLARAEIEYNNAVTLS
jgi:hypothetical protein